MTLRNVCLCAVALTLVLTFAVCQTAPTAGAASRGQAAPGRSQRKPTQEISRARTVVSVVYIKIRGNAWDTEYIGPRSQLGEIVVFANGSDEPFEFYVEDPDAPIKVSPHRAVIVRELGNRRQVTIYVTKGKFPPGPITIPPEN